MNIFELSILAYRLYSFQNPAQYLNGFKNHIKSIELFLFK